MLWDPQWDHAARLAQTTAQDPELSTVKGRGLAVAQSPQLIPSCLRIVSCSWEDHGNRGNAHALASPHALVTY